MIAIAVTERSEERQYEVLPHPLSLRNNSAVTNIIWNVIPEVDII
jgi:hypothetical protein